MLPYDSYSTLKDFDQDRKKYYKKYILKEKMIDEDEQESYASLIGSLTDCLLLSESTFDDRFHISQLDSAPTGLMLQYAEKLYAVSMKYCNEEGRLTKQFSEIAQEAYRLVGFKRDTFEKVIEKFSGSEVEKYYQELLAVRPTNKTVITPSDIALAERVKSKLKTTKVTGDILNLTTTDRYKVYNQVPILFSHLDLELKCLVDRIIVDTLERKIYIYDLKITWNVDQFVENYYLYRKSYIQAYLYYLAVSKKWSPDNKYENYQVIPMQFLVGDHLTYMDPLVYQTNMDDLRYARSGFSYKNREYKGVDQLIEELKWHKENQIWTISKENYENNGKTNLKINYDR